MRTGVAKMKILISLIAILVFLSFGIVFITGMIFSSQREAIFDAGIDRLASAFYDKTFGEGTPLVEIVSMAGKPTSQHVVRIDDDTYKPFLMITYSTGRRAFIVYSYLDVVCAARMTNDYRHGSEIWYFMDSELFQNYISNIAKDPSSL